MRKTNPFRIEWDAHIYEHKERNQDWFWAVGIVTFAIAVVSVIFGNIIFAILILTAAFSLALFINRPPETVHVVVNEKGITRGNVLYPYTSLKSYWIDIEHPHNKILLKSQKVFMPLIVIPLGKDVNLDNLDNTLSQILEKEEHQLPFVELLLEYLGF